MAIKQILRECAIFSVLSDDDLEKIADSALEKEYEAGTTIFNEGDDADELLVLQEGRIALQMKLQKELGQSSRRVSVDIVNENEVVGWSALVEPYSYTLTAVCLQKVKVLSISGNKLRWLLEDNCNIGYEVLKGLIKVVASRLEDTRRVLVSERSYH